jgi:hypothetical protein
MIKTKHTKSIGKQKYINHSTGEVETFTVIEKKVSDYNFYKVWITDLMNILELVGSKKMTVVKYILNNLNYKDNTFTKTIKIMTNELKNVSRTTIIETLKLLKDNDFLKKIHTAHYQLNPNILMRGGGNKRQNLLIQYNKEEENNNE